MRRKMALGICLAMLMVVVMQGMSMAATNSDIKANANVTALYNIRAIWNKI